MIQSPWSLHRGRRLADHTWAQRWMFILETNDVGTAMFAKGQKVESTLTYGTSGSATSASKSFKNYNWNMWYSDYQSLADGKARYVKRVSSGSSVGFHSPMRRMGIRNWLNLIHMDLWGSTQCVSISKSRYFISFIDDFSRHTWVYLIDEKSEVFSCFWDLKNFVEWEIKRKIKCLRLDGRKEYFPASSKAFESPIRQSLCSFRVGIMSNQMLCNISTNEPLTWWKMKEQCASVDAVHGVSVMDASPSLCLKTECL